MRSRGALIPVIVIILLIIVLAQNGVLGSLLAGLYTSLSSQNTFGSTLLPPGQPLISINSSGNQVVQPSNLPTASALTYPPPQVQSQPTLLPAGSQTPIPLGAVSVDGQCVVPSGWVAYTVQADETLAVIAQRFNLTASRSQWPTACKTLT